MNNTFLAFLLLCGGMYLAIKLLNLIFTRFKLLPKPDIIRPQSKTEIAVEALDYSSFQAGEFPLIDAHHIVNAGDIDAGAVGSEVVTSAEGLAEGVKALAESAVENFSTVMQSLFHQ
jgi:hypothetical protein